MRCPSAFGQESPCFPSAWRTAPRSRSAARAARTLARRSGLGTRLGTRRHRSGTGPSHAARRWPSGSRSGTSRQSTRPPTSPLGPPWRTATTSSICEGWRRSAGRRCRSRPPRHPARSSRTQWPRSRRPWRNPCPGTSSKSPGSQTLPRRPRRPVPLSGPSQPRPASPRPRRSRPASPPSPLAARTRRSRMPGIRI